MVIKENLTFVPLNPPPVSPCGHSGELHLWIPWISFGIPPAGTPRVPQRGTLRRTLIVIWKSRLAALTPLQICEVSERVEYGSKVAFIPRSPNTIQGQGYEEYQTLLKAIYLLSPRPPTPYPASDRSRCFLGIVARRVWEQT